MSKKTAAVENLTASFLTDHPEHAAEFGYHQQLGPVMSNKGVRLFTEWAVRTKRTTPEKAVKMIEIMDKINKRLAERGTS